MDDTKFDFDVPDERSSLVTFGGAMLLATVPIAMAIGMGLYMIDFSDSDADFIAESVRSPLIADAAANDFVVGATDATAKPDSTAGLETESQPNVTLPGLVIETDTNQPQSTTVTPAADTAATQGPVQNTETETVEYQVAQADAPAPVGKLTLNAPDNPDFSFTTGDKLNLTVSGSADSYVYCFYQDVAGTITQVFPTAANRDAFASADTPVSIPGQDAEFVIVFEQANIQEYFACFATGRDVSDVLSDFLQLDLQPIPAASLNGVAAVIRQAAAGPTAAEFVTLTVR